MFQILYILLLFLIDDSIKTTTRISPAGVSDERRHFHVLYPIFYRRKSFRFLAVSTFHRPLTAMTGSVCSTHTVFRKSFISRTEADFYVRKMNRSPCIKICLSRSTRTSVIQKNHRINIRFLILHSESMICCLIFRITPGKTLRIPPFPKTDVRFTRLHSDQADILPLLKMILAEAHRHEPASEQICQYLLNAFLLKIGRVTNSQFSAGSVPDISGECAQIKDYIDHHYSEEVTLDDLAALSHLNKYYLSHIFSKSYGVAPINYLLERRILNSKELLKNTDYSITHIAHMTGFSSANYFSQSFKKHTGITAAYRKNFKKKL